MSFRLKYAEKEVRYKLERAKYYNEGMSRVELVEFLSDLLDNLDADDIEDTIISDFEITGHMDCVHVDERDRLEDEIEKLKERITELEETKELTHVHVNTYESVLERNKELQAEIKRLTSKKKDKRSPELRRKSFRLIESEAVTV